MLERLLKKDPRHATAIGLLANIYSTPNEASPPGFALFDEDRAASLYSRAIEIDPSHATNRRNYELFLKRRAERGHASAGD